MRQVTLEPSAFSKSLGNKPFPGDFFMPIQVGVLGAPESHWVRHFCLYSQHCQNKLRMLSDGKAKKGSEKTGRRVYNYYNNADGPYSLKGKGGIIMLEIGTKAPEFSLQDQNGKFHSLSDYKGQKVILYFYPKDMTGDCTSQACNFRDLYPQLREKGAVVLGVSKDTVESHKRFEEKHGLPFTLIPVFHMGTTYGNNGNKKRLWL